MGWTRKIQVDSGSHRARQMSYTFPLSYSTGLVFCVFVCGGVCMCLCMCVGHCVCYGVCVVSVCLCACVNYFWFFKICLPLPLPGLKACSTTAWLTESFFTG